MVAMIKAFLNLIRKGKGRIINISSIAGIFSTIGFGSYSGFFFSLLFSKINILISLTDQFHFSFKICN